jgi:integrase
VGPYSHGGSHGPPSTSRRIAGQLSETGRFCDTSGEQHWRALPTASDPLLEAVDLHGAHDFRHTFATWLEDAGIPARAIDEVMGHEATSRLGQQRGSAMGAHYRHTTPEMAARIATAIEQRLRLVLEVAERALEGRPNRSTQRVF